MEHEVSPQKLKRPKPRNQEGKTKKKVELLQILFVSSSPYKSRRSGDAMVRAPTSGTSDPSSIPGDSESENDRGRSLRSQSSKFFFSIIMRVCEIPHPTLSEMLTPWGKPGGTITPCGKVRQVLHRGRWNKHQRPLVHLGTSLSHTCLQVNDHMGKRAEKDLYLATVG